MDEISQQYATAAQGQLSHIENVSRAFQQKCQELKDQTEQEINALDKDSPDLQIKTNQLKLTLKENLQTVLTQLERELKRSFGIGIVELEKIYHQKELRSMKILEQEILAL